MEPPCSSRRRRAREPVGPAEAPDTRNPGTWPGGDATLAAESEPSDDGTVARVVVLDEIRQKATALAHELEEAAARVIVLGVRIQVGVQPTDPLRQERDLDF